MISALGEIDDAVKALKSGAVDYLIKPFDPDELIHKIRAAVSNRRRENLIEAGARTAAPAPNSSERARPRERSGARSGRSPLPTRPCS